MQVPRMDHHSQLWVSNQPLIWIQVIQPLTWPPVHRGFTFSLFGLFASWTQSMSCNLPKCVYVLGMFSLNLCERSIGRQKTRWCESASIYACQYVWHYHMNLVLLQLWSSIPKTWINSCYLIPCHLNGNSST